MKIHGENQISIEGNIIKCKIIGDFNYEGINKSINDLKVAIESFEEDGFKLYIDYTQTEGGTPEVFDKINEFNLYLKDKNIIAKAILSRFSIMLDILKNKSPSRDFLNEKIFKDESTALLWLDSQ